MAATYFFLGLLLGGIRLAAAWSEVIPGPGLPSLESLNLTSEELYNAPSTVHIRQARSLYERAADDAKFDSVCLDQTKYGANLDELLACHAYLYKAGKDHSTNCQVQGPNGYTQVMCTSGISMVTATNIGAAPGGTSSRCDYVAFAAGWTYISCAKQIPAQNNNILASGSCAANGNGNMRVDTVLVGSQ